MTKPNYRIDSQWKSCVMSPSEIGKKFLATLDAITEINPLFRDWGTNDPFPPDWETLENMESMFIGRPIDPLRRNFTPFVETNVSRDDWGEPLPDHGYSLIAVTRYFPSAPPDPLGLSFLIQAGAISGNDYSLEAGSRVTPPEPEIVTFPIFKALLLTLVAFWPAPSASAKCSIWGQKLPTWPGDPPLRYSEYQTPWMSYLRADRAAGVTPPADILNERTPDGGLLMVATKERFDPTNRQHMRNSRAIA